MIRIGIDEAGLGPKVGPLVISAVAFRFREPPAETLWHSLGEVVCRSRRHRPTTLVVDDSKTVYSPARGLGRLEETVLAFLAATGVEAQDLAGLLEAVSVSGRRWTERYPWYGGADLPLPRTAQGLGADIKGKRLRRVMSANGVGLLTVRSLIAHPREYNWVVRRTGSKLTGLFGLVARLIQQVLPLCPEGEEVTVLCDNLGGRHRYGPLIGRFFAGSSMRIEKQSRAGSRYRVRWRSREAGARSAGVRNPGAREVRFRLAFVPDGDARHFEIALASMQSKYLRELHMELLNAYWQKQVPGLRPTAGYGRDGARFISEVEPKLAQLGLDREALVRCR